MTAARLTVTSMLANRPPGQQRTVTHALKLAEPSTIC